MAGGTIKHPVKEIFNEKLDLQMKGTGAGWDTIFYRVYIIGGLVGVVAVTIGTVIIFDPQGRTMLPVYAGGGCVTLFLLGILVYWWAQILVWEYGDVTRMAVPEETKDGTPEISDLKSWSSLFNAMVLYGGNLEALEASRRKGNRPLVEWFAWATILTLFPLVNVWLFLFGVLTQEAFLTYIRPGIVVIAVLMLIRTNFLLKGTNQSNQETIFAPLGLSLVETSPVGTVLEGERHGYKIRIVIYGSHCITYVNRRVPDFEVETKDGKFLLTEELPEDVYIKLKGFRKAKRWKGVKLQGHAEEIKVERDSRGMNMWLYDLWLAEKIA